MSEFGDYDYKNWFAWSVAGGGTVWATICQQFGNDPDKCHRAWQGFKGWTFKITGNACLLPPDEPKAETCAK